MRDQNKGHTSLLRLQPLSVYMLLLPPPPTHWPHPPHPSTPTASHPISCNNTVCIVECMCWDNREILTNTLCHTTCVSAVVVHFSILDACPQELHSSVRTNNVETCLRLLSKGADPNYFHRVSVFHDPPTPPTQRPSAVVSTSQNC